MKVSSALYKAAVGMGAVAVLLITRVVTTKVTVDPAQIEYQWNIIFVVLLTTLTCWTIGVAVRIFESMNSN